MKNSIRLVIGVVILSLAVWAGEPAPHHMGCINRLRYDSGPIRTSHDMYFDSLMTVDDYSGFVCSLPTRGSKIYMPVHTGKMYREYLDEVVWRDSSRVLFTSVYPRTFTEWKKRKEVPEPEVRPDRKVYVDSFLDGNGGLRFDRCDAPLQAGVNVYYLNVRQENRHKMDSLFDRIIFFEGHSGPSSYIKVGDQMICNE